MLQKLQSPGPKYIPIETLIHYGNQGLTQDEIAKIVGCSRPNVAQRFKAAGYTPQRLKEYRESRADILAYYQSMLLTSITPSEVKCMPVDRRVVAMGILYDKERLERGQSTSNIQSLTMIVEQAHARKPAPIQAEPDDVPRGTIEHETTKPSADRPVAE